MYTYFFLFFIFSIFLKIVAAIDNENGKKNHRFKLENINRTMESEKGFIG